MALLSVIPVTVADERKTPRPLLQHERKILRPQRRVDCGVYVSRGRVEVDRQDGRLPPRAGADARQNAGGA